MTLPARYDRFAVGFAGGLILPFITGLVIFLFTSHDLTLHAYLYKIRFTGIMTHAVTLCVFSNIVIFLLFNRLDMLRAARGTLAVTIIWALTVVIIKFFT
jgi:hypothetical protein